MQYFNSISWTSRVDRHESPMLLSASPAIPDHCASTEIMTLTRDVRHLWLSWDLTS